MKQFILPSLSSSLLLWLPPLLLLGNTLLSTQATTIKYDKCYIFNELHNNGSCDDEYTDFNRYVFNWHVCPCEELYCYKAFDLPQYCENFTSNECKEGCVSYIEECCDYHPKDCKITGHVQPPMMAIRGARIAEKTNHHGY